LFPPLSVTFTVILPELAAVGVPLSTPAVDRLRPDASVPLVSVQLPLLSSAARVTKYALPTVPAGSDVVVTVSDAYTVRVNDAPAMLPALSVTFTVMLAELAAEGVPLSTPADDRLRPDGKVPLVSVQPLYAPVPPLAAKAAEYALPTTPVGSEEVRALSCSCKTGGGSCILKHHPPIAERLQ
jgi:hypothetical protein